MKDERLEAVLRSSLATIVKMGMKSPPPPIPPALAIEEAMKQKIAASTIGRDASELSWGVMNSCVVLSRCRTWCQTWWILKISEDGGVCFALEGIVLKDVVKVRTKQQHARL